MQGGATALMMAALEGHDGIVDLLVKAGASLDVQSKVGGHGWWTRRIHPLTHLTLGPPIQPGPVPPHLPHGDRPELVLTPSCPRMVQNGCTALMLAAGNGCNGMVDLLIEAGADATLQAGRPKMTALECAKQGKHAKCVAILEDAQSAKVEPQMLPPSHLSWLHGG